MHISKDCTSSPSLSFDVDVLVLPLSKCEDVALFINICISGYIILLNNGFVFKDIEDLESSFMEKLYLKACLQTYWKYNMPGFCSFVMPLTVHSRLEGKNKYVNFSPLYC